MNTSIHICTNPFENESRILKETKSLIDYNIVDKVIVIATWKHGLPASANIDDNRSVVRVRSRYFRWNPPRGFRRITKVLRLLFASFHVIQIIRKNNPKFINFHHVRQLPLVPVIGILMPRTKLIYDTHELETETSGLRNPAKFINKLTERVTIRLFSHVFVVSPSIENWYKNVYKISNVTTLLNCPYPAKIEKTSLLRNELSISDQSIIFIYQGGLAKARGMDLLLTAFKEINDPGYVIIFMGFGEFEQPIKVASAEYSNIFFRKAVTTSELLKYTASADVGVHTIKNTCLNHNYCLPNKLFEYLIAGIPCIVPDLKEMKSYIEKNKVGYLFKQESKEDLIRVIKQMGQADISQFNEPIRVAQAEYNWKEEEKKMIRVYNELVTS